MDAEIAHKIHNKIFKYLLKNKTTEPIARKTIHLKQKFGELNLIEPEAHNYNPGQNILYQEEKSSKVGQDFKSLLSNFACFLTAIVKV